MRIAMLSPCRRSDWDGTLWQYLALVANWWTDGDGLNVRIGFPWSGSVLVYGAARGEDGTE